MYEMEIQYNILNCTATVDKMIEIFKEYHPDIYDVPLQKGKGNVESAAAMAPVVAEHTKMIMKSKHGW